MMKKPKPLTPAVMHILLALTSGERHGYAIMKQVEFESAGRVIMGPGTLYGSIARMMKDGLVSQGETRHDRQLDDARRIYYRLTALGEQVLAEELSRYRQILAAAERKKLLQGAAYG